MAKTKPTKILLKGGGVESELPLNDPGVYEVNIIPGHLIERMTTGKVRPHSTSTGAAARLFALSMPFIGVSGGALGEGRAWDSPYIVADETVRFVYAEAGSWINALLAAGTGNDVAIGDLLESAGDGTLKKGTTNPVARAMEHIDNDPGSGGAAVRLKVEVI